MRSQTPYGGAFTFEENDTLSEICDPGNISRVVRSAREKKEGSEVPVRLESERRRTIKEPHSVEENREVFRRT